MRTWKIDGPPEIVAGIVMNVMTSCSLRPASRARKPPMDWMPSWELPARRMTTSGSSVWETSAGGVAEGALPARGELGLTIGVYDD